MVPLILAPALNVAWGRGVSPGVPRFGGGSLVDGYIPGSSPAVALHAVEHGLSAGDHLVHVQLKIFEAGISRREVDPGIEDEIRRRFVISKRNTVALATEILVGHRKFARRARTRRRTGYRRPTA